MPAARLPPTAREPDSRVRVYVPRDTPQLLVEEMRELRRLTSCSSTVSSTTPDGMAAEYARETGAFNVATFREPYRVEGKKTMGFELVEQLGGVPGTIIYPTGGGTGPRRDVEGVCGVGAARLDRCGAPRHGWPFKPRAARRSFALSIAARESRRTGRERRRRRCGDCAFPAGSAIVSLCARCANRTGTPSPSPTRAADDAMRDLHREEGIDATEEGGATLAALRILLGDGVALPAPIVLFNTATSLKYAPRA